MSSISEGDLITVRGEISDGTVVLDGEQDCTVRFIDTPEVEEGVTREITATVVKTVYSQDGDLSMLLLAADPSDKDITTSGGTSSSSSTVSSKSKSQRHKPSSASSSTERSSTASNADHHDELDELAAELIGDEDLEVTEDEDSVVSDAKEKARNQGRDPAIDPEFQ